MNFFEDFSVGRRFVHATPRTVTEGDCALYIGLTGDRYALHCSAEYARSLGWPVREIAADHEALATAPDLLVSALLEAAGLDPAGPEPRRWAGRHGQTWVTQLSGILCSKRSVPAA